MPLIKFIAGIALLLITLTPRAQSCHAFADSIRIQYHIPELGYAVVSSDSVLDIYLTGVRKAGTALNAASNDRFRIGSNTKAITAFIAARLVQQGKIKWDTQFFDLLPELKKQSNSTYYNITLEGLLSFRYPLSHYTYTDAKPNRQVIEHGTKSKAEIRTNFAKWVLRQKPVAEKKEIYFSNPAYSLACLMLEKSSGKSYETLVGELGIELNIDFHFGNPDTEDSLQTWGHAEAGMPEARGDNYKLQWLLAAGNINLTLSDYTRFIRSQLKGLKGESNLLSKNDFDHILFGKPKFALGWFCDTAGNGHVIAHNTGNPGSFTTEVVIVKEIDRAYLVFTNAQNASTTMGIEILMQGLKKRYGY